MKQYVWNILISLDQLLNTIMAGNPDETISSRCGKRIKDRPRCRYVCKMLNWFQCDHCIEPIEEVKK